MIFKWSEPPSQLTTGWNPFPVLVSGFLQSYWASESFCRSFREAQREGQWGWEGQPCWNQSLQGSLGVLAISERPQEYTGSRLLLGRPWMPLTSQASGGARGSVLGKLRLMWSSTLSSSEIQEKKKTVTGVRNRGRPWKTRNTSGTKHQLFSAHTKQFFNSLQVTTWVSYNLIQFLPHLDLKGERLDHTSAWEEYWGICAPFHYNHITRVTGQANWSSMRREPRREAERERFQNTTPQTERIVW